MDIIKYRCWDKKRKIMFQSNNPAFSISKWDDGTFHGYVLTENKGEVRECVLMQFIGKQDVNKIDIYENDIYTTKIGDRFCGKDIVKIPDIYMLANEIKIIGNIFQNSHLLDKK